METRVNWTDGLGEEFHSIPLSRFWYDGHEYVVVTGRISELVCLVVVERDTTTDKEILIGDMSDGRPR